MSKTARNIAVNVTQMQISQKKINQKGCSRGLRVDCKNVEPQNNKTSAAINRVNMVLRRVFGSRIMPRVAWMMNEVVRNGFSSGELLVTV